MDKGSQGDVTAKINNIDRPIFVLGSGRSGTTLIQRALNSYDDVIIWGEHSGFISDLAKSYFTITRHPSMQRFCYSKYNGKFEKYGLTFFKDPELWQAWINPFSQKEVQSYFRKLIVAIFNPTGDVNLRWGFKEIRYGTKSLEVDFLLELFPQASFICLSRNSFNTIESQLTTFHQGESKYLALKRLLQIRQIITLARRWESQNRQYKTLSELYSSNVFFYSYEDVITRKNLRLEFFKKLGLTFGSRQQEVFNLRKGRGSGFDSNSSIDTRWKRLGFIAGIIVAFITNQTHLQLGYSIPKRYKFGAVLNDFLSLKK